MIKEVHGDSDGAEIRKERKKSKNLRIKRQTSGSEEEEEK